MVPVSLEMWDQEFNFKQAELVPPKGRSPLHLLCLLKESLAKFSWQKGNGQDSKADRPSSFIVNKAPSGEE